MLQNQQGRKKQIAKIQYKRTVGSSPFSSNRVKKRAAYIYLEKPITQKQYKFIAIYIK